MKEEQIPKRTLRFLRFICPERLIEEIEGDLFEHFSRDLKKYDEATARRRFIMNSIKYLRPGILLRNRFSYNLIPYDMLSNYFKIAWRVMLRTRAFSSINILGLTVGMTGALLLFLWIQEEFSYEDFHTDKERIYKAWNRNEENGQIKTWDVTPRILAPTLKEEFPAIENAVSFARWGSKQAFTYNDTRLFKTTGAYTDSAFLTIFSFPMRKGNAATALNDPTSVVITESFAKHLFGEHEPLGETISLEESGYKFEFTVTGILQDLSSNTDFRFEYLIPFKFLESLGEKDTNWNINSVSTWVKIKEGASIEALNELVKDVKKKHAEAGMQNEVFLYPLAKMRLYSRFENGVAAGGRIEIITMLGILGVCLVLIACINFINLSTARSQRRAKEVGVRKVIGAFRGYIVLQFLCESVLIALGAGILAIGAAYLILPYFNILIQQQLSLQFESLNFWILTTGLIILVGIIAGSYPALYLSSFRPVKILKGEAVSGRGNMMRSILVVFQFGFSVMLVISAIVIYQQIRFVQNREAGYEKENLIYQPLTGTLKKNFLAYKNELLQSDVALSVTRTSMPITERWSNTSDMEWRGKRPDDKISIERMYVDDAFVTTAGLTILEGRDMDLSRFPTDSTAVILNESAVKAMNFENPIGEVITDNSTDWHVIGVMKDFILTSPFQNVEPLAVMGSEGNWSLEYVHIKLNPAFSSKESVNKLENMWSAYNPDFPFEYQFTDVEYQRKFVNLEKTLTITTVFTSLAIFIACLGLLGLSTYMIEARVKEIGIRKVFGGSVFSITRLLSFSALKPIVFGILLFSPVAWFTMNWWLQFYVYRIDLTLSVFIVAAVVLMSIAFLTIGIQTIAAANTNPVKSLRNE